MRIRKSNITFLGDFATTVTIKGLLPVYTGLLAWQVILIEIEKKKLPCLELVNQFKSYN